MRHRRLLTFLVAFGLALTTAATLAQDQRTRRDSIRMALTGDSIVNQRFSVFTEPAFLGVVKILREADFAFTNFESLIPNGKGYPRHPPTGIYMNSPSPIANDLVWAGIDVVNVAHNHAADYLTDGLIETNRVLTEAGLTVAGFGMNLAEARAPKYLETAKGRIAVIGMWSTDYDKAELHRAGMQGRSIRGRPGINVVRLEMDYMVDAATLNTLKDIATKAKIPFSQPRPPTNSRFSPQVDGTRPVDAIFGTTRLVVGPSVRTRTRALQVDEEGVVASIKEARRQADWVMVEMHDGGEEFHAVFAKTCIDAGADLFLAHGDHHMHGVEIYKGKPIFYGTGDLFLQNETVNLLPYEEYEMYGLDDNKLTPADFYDNRSANDTIGFPADEWHWQNVIAVPEFRGGQLKDITFYPIDLGNKASRSQRGRALLADPALSKKIIDRLAEMSKRYGTVVTYENGLGRVRIAASN